MLKIKVKVDDWDTGETIELTLPCDIKNKIDTSHNLYIMDWDGEILIGFYDDVAKLNNLLDDINAESPTMTVEILEAILKASGCGELSDKYFMQKICTSDFMLEEITGVDGDTDEEKCARYLAVEMAIPFAKNITNPILEGLITNSVLADKVAWGKVWKHYETMGFETILIDKKLYVFHWGDAVEE